jgi:hypothetical protein
MEDFHMTEHGKRLRMAVLAGCTAAMMTGLVGAADFAQRTQAESLARKQGFVRTEVGLLKRMPGPGRERASRMLLERFSRSTSVITTGGKMRTEKGRNSLDTIGNGWFLHVQADGSKARYRNYAYLDGDKNKPIPVEKRLAPDKLEALGREFIGKQLDGVVKLGPGEALVPHFTEHQIGGGSSTKEGATPDPEYVAASTVVFTRELNGVRVIGPGSKIAVIFANDGSAVGFDYDWPVYQAAGKSQKLESVGAIRARAKKLGALDAQMADTTEKRFECGYYDMGARGHDPRAAVQAGCAIHGFQRRIVDQAAHDKDRRSGHIVVARVDVIPAGSVIEPDSRWNQAAALLGKPIAKPRPPAAGPKARPTRPVRPVAPAGTLRPVP